MYDSPLVLLSFPRRSNLLHGRSVCLLDELGLCQTFVSTDARVLFGRVLYLGNSVNPFTASTPVRGAGQEEAGAGDTATAGTVAAECDTADASTADGRQEEGVRASSATGPSAATTHPTIADRSRRASICFSRV